jgi:hypothetical protein
MPGERLGNPWRESGACQVRDELVPQGVDVGHLPGVVHVAQEG